MHHYHLLHKCISKWGLASAGVENIRYVPSTFKSLANSRVKKSRHNTVVPNHKLNMLAFTAYLTTFISVCTAFNLQGEQFVVLITKLEFTFQDSWPGVCTTGNKQSPIALPKFEARGFKLDLDIRFPADSRTVFSIYIEFGISNSWCCNQRFH